MHKSYSDYMIHEQIGQFDEVVARIREILEIKIDDEVVRSIDTDTDEIPQ